MGICSVRYMLTVRGAVASTQFAYDATCREVIDQYFVHISAVKETAVSGRVCGTTGTH